MLSRQEIADLEHELEIVPRREGACIEALKVVQRHRGWVSDEAVGEVADFLGMSPAEVDSIATFYNLIFRHPVGRHVIFLCDSVSCWLLESDAVREGLRRRLGIGFGETTADGRFTLLPIQCLGTCDRAPALMVDEDLHREVDPTRLDEILGGYE
ncbi:MAG TPA: NADH-quinone oxidoreductase subunit NuoE [Thermoanaerobaculia bacterium]|nr:NADH-quinone oxidoreductase subunit NuoE [Thermoanaerobaculia bacterium]